MTEVEGANVVVEPKSIAVDAASAAAVAVSAAEVTVHVLDSASCRRTVRSTYHPPWLTPVVQEVCQAPSCEVPPVLAERRRAAQIMWYRCVVVVVVSRSLLT